MYTLYQLALVPYKVNDVKQLQKHVLLFGLNYSVIDVRVVTTCLAICDRIEYVYMKHLDNPKASLSGNCNCV